MKSNNIINTVRMLLTAGLCALVWLNAHWSVALSITLLFISDELHTYALNKVVGGRRI